ncbi:hypothetical protein BDD12DRAFT_802602 [Trichophaea hybrida]|nr:hypothetical protein BDD12DRAFT_802602 [Trichophaea hybrida]
MNTSVVTEPGNGSHTPKKYTPSMHWGRHSDDKGPVSKYNRPINAQEFPVPRQKRTPTTLPETVQSRFLFSKNPVYGPLAAINKRSPSEKYCTETLPIRTTRVDNTKKEGIWRGGRKVSVEDDQDDQLHLRSNPGTHQKVSDQIFTNKLPTQQLYSQLNLTPSPIIYGNRALQSSTPDTDSSGGGHPPVSEIPIPPLQASTEIWKNIAMEATKIEQLAKPKGETCPPTTDAALPVNGYGLDAGITDSTTAILALANGMAKSVPQHSTTSDVPGKHFNPQANYFVPKRCIPKNWYNQCRWTYPPGDNGRGVDNCRWGRRCDFGHPGEEYFEYPGIKNEFRNNWSIAPIGAMFMRPGDLTVYSMNPRAMNQHVIQQRYGYPTYPNIPGYGGSMYFHPYGMPPMQQMQPMQPMPSIPLMRPMLRPMPYPSVATPSRIAHNERLNGHCTEETSLAKKQDEIIIPGYNGPVIVRSPDPSPVKRQDEIIIAGYNGPVIVRSPEYIRPAPFRESTPKRSDSPESEASSSGTDSGIGGDPKPNGKSDSDSSPQASASDEGVEQGGVNGC